MTKNSFFEKTVHFTRENIPFVFLIDFEKNKPQLYSFQEALENGIYVNIKGKCNFTKQYGTEIKPQITKQKFCKENYAKAFYFVQKEIHKGNSFLTNLTFPLKIDLDGSLESVFHQANAPYKLLVQDCFTVFSPECFIKIKEGKIYTYPMKGTIAIKAPNAKKRLLENRKEQYEHNTIVDLMRNDLSRIANNVTVSKFRYIEKINGTQGALYQTSSEIYGTLKKNWKNNLGELLYNLLPAGSISGAPKDKTVAIINAAEQEPRGYYTGIFGVYDGEELDSGIMIRYIEKTNSGYYFRSGGGITALSKEIEEYHEFRQKIFLPIV